MRKDRPCTPDGRYFVARGVLRRSTSPHLSDSERRRLIKALMQARMAMRAAQTDAERADVNSRIDAAKRDLGEAGPVWWSDGSADLSGQAPDTTPYSEWWSALPEDVRHAGEEDKRG